MKYWETPLDNGELLKTILKDVEKSKELKGKGKPYKTAKEMCEEYEISMDTLREIIKVEKEAKDFSTEKFLLSGNIRIEEDGRICKAYCRAGELMVKSIEEAYQTLGFKVPITGEYLFGRSWAECH